MTTATSLADSVNALRAELGVPAAELASVLGVGRSTMWRALTSQTGNSALLMRALVVLADRVPPKSA